MITTLVFEQEYFFIGFTVLFIKVLWYNNNMIKVDNKRNKLPLFFKLILWSYDFNSINIEEDKRVIIINTINYGDLKHWRWIIKNYSKKSVKKILMEIPFTEIRARVAPLVSIIFSINKFNHVLRSNT